MAKIEYMLEKIYTLDQNISTSFSRSGEETRRVSINNEAIEESRVKVRWQYYYRRLGDEIIVIKVPMRIEITLSDYAQDNVQIREIVKISLADEIGSRALGCKPGKANETIIETLEKLLKGEEVREIPEGLGEILGERTIRQENGVYKVSNENEFLKAYLKGYLNLPTAQKPDGNPQETKNPFYVVIRGRITLPENRGILDIDIVQPVIIVRYPSSQETAQETEAPARQEDEVDREFERIWNEITKYQLGNAILEELGSTSKEYYYGLYKRVKEEGYLNIIKEAALLNAHLHGYPRGFLFKRKINKSGEHLEIIFILYLMYGVSLMGENQYLIENAFASIYQNIKVIKDILRKNFLIGLSHR